MGHKEIQRLADIEHSKHKDIFILSEKGLEIASVIEQQTINRLLPLLLKQEINHNEYNTGTTLLHNIQINIKKVLKVHQEKEFIYLKDTAQLKKKRLVTDIAYSTYEDNFNNQTKRSSNKNLIHKKQQRIFSILLEKITSGKVNKKKNIALDVRLGRNHTIESNYYQNNALAVTIDELQDILEKNHQVYLEYKEKQNQLFKEYKTIASDRQSYIEEEQDPDNYLNDSQKEKIFDIKTFVAYLEEEGVKIKSARSGRMRPMTFRDMRSRFLPFGQEYFNDDTRLAIISGYKKTVGHKIQAYNEKIVAEAEDESIKITKEEFVDMFSQEDKKKSGPERYVRVFSLGFTKTALKRLSEEYNIKLGKNIHQIADRFGWLEHIIKDKTVCEKYLKARASNNRTVLDGIISTHPMQITWPEGESIKKSTTNYISLPVRHKAEETKKKELMQKNVSSEKTYESKEFTYYKNNGKKEGCMGKSKITKEDVLKSAADIFPEGIYDRPTYKKYRDTLNTEEQEEWPKGGENILYRFGIHSDYYTDELLKALILGDKITEQRVINERNNSLEKKAYKPTHIKTLLVICNLLECKNQEGIYMILDDIQKTDGQLEVDKQKGLSRRTKDNFHHIKKKYGITKKQRWLSPQSLRSNLLGRHSINTTTSYLYNSLIERRNKYIDEGIFSQENIQNILTPGGEKYINKPLNQKKMTPKQSHL